MCISVQMEIRIVPNMIPDTFLGRENQSVRLFLEIESGLQQGAHITAKEQKTELIAKPIGPNRHYQVDGRLQHKAAAVI